MTTRCHSVLSLRSPESLSFQLSEVAMFRLTTLVPLAVFATFGSAPKLPTKITLLILPTIVMYLFLKLKLRELYIDFFQMKTEINRPVYIPRYGFDKCRN